jgi:hypothetical protein
MLINTSTMTAKKLIERACVSCLIVSLHPMKRIIHIQPVMKNTQRGDEAFGLEVAMYNTFMR